MSVWSKTAEAVRAFYRTVTRAEATAAKSAERVAKTAQESQAAQAAVESGAAEGGLAAFLNRAPISPHVPTVPEVAQAATITGAPSATNAFGRAARGAGTATKAVLQEAFTKPVVSGGVGVGPFHIGGKVIGRSFSVPRAGMAIGAGGYVLKKMGVDNAIGRGVDHGVKAVGAVGTSVEKAKDFLTGKGDWWDKIKEFLSFLGTKDGITGGILTTVAGLFLVNRFPKFIASPASSAIVWGAILLTGAATVNHFAADKKADNQSPTSSAFTTASTGAAKPQASGITPPVLNKPAAPGLEPV